MYSDRNLINRRNVKSDVSAAANACRRFFTIEVESRIIAATMSVLGIEKLDDEEFPLPINEMSTKDEKKTFLQKTAALVADKFVVDEQRNEKILNSMQVIQEYTEAKKRSATAQGRCIPADIKVALKHSHMTVNAEGIMSHSITLHQLLMMLIYPTLFVILKLMNRKEMTCMHTRKHY